MPLIVIVMRRLVTFCSSPEAGPLLLAAIVTAGAGLALGFAWVPPTVAVALFFLVMTSGGDDDDPQHPVLA